MKFLEDEWVKNPKSVNDVIRCLNGIVMDSSIAFYEGSKYTKKIKGTLIRDAIKDIISRKNIPKYTCALIKSININESDEYIENEWKNSIDALRILYHASPVGTKRQKELLISVARNKNIVHAMQIATISEMTSSIEPTWLAVFSADATEASLKIIKSVENQLSEKTRLVLADFENLSNL